MPQRPLSQTPALLEPRDTPALIGAFDPSFGTAGQTTAAGASFLGVALQADGKVVAVGSRGGDFAVARFNPDGSFDTSFNTTGTQTIDFGAADIANAVAVQADGKIVVAGSSAGDGAVARLNPDGSPDTSFNGTGKKTINLGGATDSFRAAAVQPDGKIVLAGSNGADFVVTRLVPADGSADPAFNGTGVATVDFGGTNDFASAVGVQADGKVVVAGGDGTDFAVARLTPGGAPDPAFNGGTRTFDVSGGPDSAASLAIQADGKIVVAGGTPSDFAVVRLAAADGALDPTFNGTGTQTVDFGGTEFLSAVRVGADGKVVLIGSTTQGGNLAVARLTTTGQLDPSFNGTGRAAISSGGTETAAAGLLTPEGRIVAAGFQGANGFVARLTGTVEKSPQLAAGGSPNATARVYAADPAAGQFVTPGAAVSPFGGLGVDVRAASGDVNGDGVPDTVLVTGPGTPIRLAVVSGADNTTLLASPFDPFGGGFVGGGFVTVGDFTNAGRVQIAVTPDQGGGPRVTVFQFQGSGLAQAANFFGIADPNFRGGARAGVGDVNADGTADLAVAAGFQGGPRVAVFDGKTLFSGTPTRLVNDFFAFPDVLRNGVYVSIGDVDGDGYGDLVFGAGPGGGPRVLVVSGKAVVTQGAAAAINSPIANFFVAGTDGDRGGVRTAAVDVDQDNRADIAVATGGGQPSRVRVYLGKTLGGGEPAAFQDIDPFGAVLADGVFVG